MSVKISIKTFGCQMNVRDSEVVLGLLKNAGYIITDDSKKADIVLFNTCSVRQHAEDRVWSEIGTFKDTDKIVGLIGCMAQEHKEKAFERMENIDLVVGPSDIEKIPAIIKKVLEHREKNKSKDLFEYKIWETDGEKRPDEIYHSGFYEDKNHAYVVISEGCSNYCSYCVVPYVRGELKNRKHEDVINEIKEAIKKGITKITLLGQNVNAYKDKNVDFVELLTQINAIKGLDELSFFTSHPKDTSVKLFEAMRDLEKVKKHLHLPIQSGSDRVLKLMNRNYNRNFYLDLVDKYRKIVKGGILSTDIIVGFPAESEEDFKDTFDLAEKVKFNSAYIFKYSPRAYTEAAKFADSISKEEKEKRHAAILDLQRKISKQLKK